jgi:hypothetical protein
VGGVEGITAKGDQVTPYPGPAKRDWPAQVEKLLGALEFPATPEQLKATIARLGWTEELGASVLVRAEDDGFLEWRGGVGGFP